MCEHARPVCEHVCCSIHGGLIELAILCVCVCELVLHQHSLLIWNSVVSKLQACMIKHYGLDVKPNQRKQS